MKVSMIVLAISILIGCAPPDVIPGPKGDTGAQGIQGTQGLAGIAGQDGESIQASPFCPDIHGGIGFQESYLILASGLYAVYYDGTHTFLALLKTGSYVTTDGRSCHFTVNANNTLSY